MSQRRLLIDYDEVAEQLVFYEQSEGNSPVLEIKVPISLFQEKSPDEAERTLGAAVFTFLDRRAVKKISIRDYGGEARASLRQRNADLRDGANGGNPQAQYELALDLLAEAVRKRSKIDLDKSDALIRSAAEAGHAGAREYLRQHWDRERAAALRSIEG